jgi:hypothetical protein
MASKVEIINMALTQLSQSRITSIDDNTIPAQDASAIYNLVVEEIMSNHTFPSTIKRATLAQSADVPEFEYAYKYQLPTDPKCLRPLRINGQEAARCKYRIESGYLLSDDSEVALKYVGLIEDTESYDAFLTQAIVKGIISKLAYKYTASASLAKALQDSSDKDIVKLAARAENSAGTSEIVRSDKYINTRL